MGKLKRVFIPIHFMVILIYCVVYIINCYKYFWPYLAAAVLYGNYCVAGVGEWFFL